MSERGIQFVDLRAQHDEIRADIESAFRRIIDDSAFIGGPVVEEFERRFAEFTGSPYAIGVANGTDAVRLALQVVGVGRDDLVVTASHTFIGTTEGVEQLGAEPVFVDVDPVSKTISPAAVAEFLASACALERGALRHRATGRRIAALLPVHLYGQTADMAPLLELGQRYGVPVVEDAAQGHGAEYRFPDGRVARCGAMGDAAAFSFYPGKNLGAMGEAGAVTVPTAERAERVRQLRDHGQSEKYIHVTAAGGNARLDALQAAVLTLKLARLDTWNAARRAHAERYAAALAGLPGIELPREMPYAHHVYHLYVIQAADREALRRALGARRVPTGLHYPVPLHLQPAYRDRALVAGPLAVTERLASTCLSLPMHPHLDDDQVDQIAEGVAAEAGLLFA